MAAITIKGIRIKSLTIQPQQQEHTETLNCTYELINSVDKVLAEQSVGGYSGMKVPFSPATDKLFHEFLTAYRGDICALIGIDAA